MIRIGTLFCLLVLISCSQESTPGESEAPENREAFISAIGPKLQITSQEILASIDKKMNEALASSQKAKEIYDQQEAEADFNKILELAQNDKEGFQKEIDKFGKSENERVGKIASAEELLSAAAKMVDKERSDLSFYTALKLTIRVFEEDYMKGKRVFNFSPELLIQPPQNVAIDSCPKAAEKYATLMTDEGSRSYWDNELYKELLKLSADQLPEDALEAISYLSTRNADYLTREGYKDETAEAILIKYGEKALPCVYKILLQPETYALVSGQRIKDTKANYLFLGYVFSDYFKSLSEQRSEEFFRLTQEAGWREIGGELPETEWAKKILADFDDSPYGRPYKPYWQRG